MKAGIVGLPNVGKSTLFNCLSNAKAQSANFPFCTIEPNIGVVNVPDSRLEKLEELVKPERVLPATVEIVDIAGLVKGASKGESLGNKRSEEHTSELQSRRNLVCRLLLEKKKNQKTNKKIFRKKNITHNDS